MNCNNRLKNYEVCKISNVGPMKAYEKIMHGCIGWSWLHNVLKKPK